MKIFNYIFCFSFNLISVIIICSPLNSPETRKIVHRFRKVTHTKILLIDMIGSIFNYDNQFYRSTSDANSRTRNVSDSENDGEKEDENEANDDDDDDDEENRKRSFYLKSNNKYQNVLVLTILTEKFKQFMNATLHLELIEHYEKRNRENMKILRLIEPSRKTILASSSDNGFVSTIKGMSKKIQNIIKRRRRRRRNVVKNENKYKRVDTVDGTEDNINKKDTLNFEFNGDATDTDTMNKSDTSGPFVSRITSNQNYVYDGEKSLSDTTRNRPPPSPSLLSSSSLSQALTLNYNSKSNLSPNDNKKSKNIKILSKECDLENVLNKFYSQNVTIPSSKSSRIAANVSSHFHIVDDTEDDDDGDKEVNVPVSSDGVDSKKTSLNNTRKCSQTNCDQVNTYYIQRLSEKFNVSRETIINHVRNICYDNENDNFFSKLYQSEKDTLLERVVYSELFILYDQLSAIIQQQQKIHNNNNKNNNTNNNKHIFCNTKNINNNHDRDHNNRVRDNVTSSENMTSSSTTSQSFNYDFILVYFQKIVTTDNVSTVHVWRPFLILQQNQMNLFTTHRMLPRDYDIDLDSWLEKPMLVCGMLCWIIIAVTIIVLIIIIFSSVIVGISIR